MPAEVKEGGTYTCEKPMNRDSWSMFRVKGAGSQELAVFGTRNLNLMDGDKVKVTKIHSVKFSARQVKDRQGNQVKDENGKPKWQPSLSMNVDMEICGRDSSPGFEDIDDAELPF